MGEESPLYFNSQSLYFAIAYASVLFSAAARNLTNLEK
jgi:hypothetical protein